MYITTCLHPTATPALKISAVRPKEHSAKMVLDEVKSWSLLSYCKNGFQVQLKEHQSGVKGSGCQNSCAMVSYSIHIVMHILYVYYFHSPLWQSEISS